MEEKLNRTNDYLFKWLFSSNERKSSLLSLINSVLGDDDTPTVIRDIELINRELDPSYYQDKASRLDILGETADGRKVNIEVQTSDESNMDQRTLFYWSRLYADQLMEGMNYNQLHPVIMINILTFKYFSSNSYHNQFVVMEKTQHYSLNDELQIHFIELKKWKNLGKKAQNRLERWLLYLSNSNPEELEEIAMQDRDIAAVMEAEKKFMSDKDARYMYLLREKSKLDFNTAIDNAKTKGREEERIAFIRNMYSVGVELDTIIKLTGLNKEQIMEIVGAC